MLTPAHSDDRFPSTASESLEIAETMSRRIRARRGWYIVGALVMAVVLAAFVVALAAWPEHLAQVIVPGLILVGAILAVLGWSGRTMPAATVTATNRVVGASAVLLLVALLLIRFVLPEGFSVWTALIGALPALPFLYLAWRAGRA